MLVRQLEELRPGDSLSEELPVDACLFFFTWGKENFMLVSLRLVKLDKHGGVCGWCQASTLAYLI